MSVTSFDCFVADVPYFARIAAERANWYKPMSILPQNVILPLRNPVFRTPRHRTWTGMNFRKVRQ